MKNNMKEVTLEDLKKPYKNMEEFESFDEWNCKAIRYHMTNGMIDITLYDITHDDNDLRPNSEIVNLARFYYQNNLMTDEEVKKYLIPAINEQIKKNNRFVRWMPGSLLRNKETGKLCILVGDYAHVCSGYGTGRNYTSLEVCDLDDDNNIIHHWAWANYNNYELVDTEHNSERLKQVLDYDSDDNF